MKVDSKRAVAVEIFNTNLKTLSKVGGKAFRKSVLESIQSKTGASVACAAAMYNFAKKQAGNIEGLGRSAVKVPVVAVVDTNAWAVVDAEGKQVGTYVSRAKARAAKGEGQRVVARG